MLPHHPLFPPLKQISPTTPPSTTPPAVVSTPAQPPTPPEDPLPPSIQYSEKAPEEKTEEKTGILSILRQKIIGKIITVAIGLVIIAGAVWGTIYAFEWYRDTFQTPEEHDLPVVNPEAEAAQIREADNLKRETDLSNLQTAIDKYYLDFKRYPSADEIESELVDKEYLPLIPEDPRQSEEDTIHEEIFGYVYAVYSSSQGPLQQYILSTNLDNPETPDSVWPVSSPGFTIPKDNGFRDLSLENVKLIEPYESLEETETLEDINLQPTTAPTKTTENESFVSIPTPQPPPKKFLSSIESLFQVISDKPPVDYSHTEPIPIPVEEAPPIESDIEPAETETSSDEETVEPTRKKVSRQKVSRVKKEKTLGATPDSTEE